MWEASRLMNAGDMLVSVCSLPQLLAMKRAAGRAGEDAPLTFEAVQAAQQRRWCAATPAERLRALQDLYGFVLACGAVTRDRARREQSRLARWNRPAP